MAWLLAWIWQGVALTLLVGLALRAARRLNAATKAVVWWITLAVLLALPALVALANHPAQSAGPVSVTGGSPSGATMLQPIVIPAAPDWLLAIAIGAWLGFMLRGLFGIVYSFVRLRDIKQGGEPVEPAREARLAGWLAARARGRPATLALSDEVALPSALGLGRAVVMVPRDLAGNLADADLDQIVLHEYAHLERRDDVARLVQQVVMSVAGVHPAIRWAGRALDLEHEAACDDFVVARTGEARRYAACLMRVAELAAQSSERTAARYSLAPGATRAGRQLARRVGRLLDRDRGRRPWSIGAAFGVGTLTAAVATATVATLGALIVLVDAVPEWSGPVVLQSRQVVIGPAGLAPRVEATAVPTSEQWPNAWDPSGPPEPPASPFAGETVALVWGQTLPGTPVGVPPTEVPHMNAVDLRAMSIAERLGGTESLWPVSALETRGAPDAAARGPWRKVAGAGTAIGTGVKSASVATAGFLARAGTSIARAF